MYRLYTFLDGNLVSFSRPDKGINGWYGDLAIACRDFERCQSIFDFQFILIDQWNNKILKVSGLTY